MSVALIIVIALVIAAVTGLKIYLENREIKKETSVTITTPVVVETQEPLEVQPISITRSQPAIEVKPKAPITYEEPALKVETAITDKTVAAPTASAPIKPKTGKKPFKKKAFKPKTATK